MFVGKPVLGTSNTSFGTGTSLFEQNTPATSLFGQPQQQTQQTLLFGANPAGIGLFGQDTTNNATTGTSLLAPNGTTVKFEPVIGQDTMPLKTKCMCITAMKQYESKCIEELRLEDYLAGRKAPVFGTTVKFEPVIGQDTMLNSHKVSTKYMCITAMKQYESKCIEELRLEDYLAGRKAPVFGTTVKFETVIGQDTIPVNTKCMCITAMKQYESKCIEELRLEDYLAGRKAPALGTFTPTASIFGQLDATSKPSPSPSGALRKNDHSGDCSICLEAGVNAVIYTCGHMCMCYECALKIKKQTGTCPLCRGPIKDVIKTFKS